MLMFARRLFILAAGLMVFSFGIVVILEAGIGINPWDVFHQGVANVTSLTIGQACVAVGLLILLGSLLLGEKFGIGTILNTVLVGVFMDMFLELGFIPQQQSFTPGLLQLLIGVLFMGLGTYLYLSTQMGCGPRDGFMIALTKRFKRVPVGVVRSGLEFAACGAGYALGGDFGIGTIVVAFGIGAAVQLWFKVFRFDVKKIQHQSFSETMKELRIGRSAVL